MNMSTQPTGNSSPQSSDSLSAAELVAQLTAPVQTETEESEYTEESDEVEESEQSEESTENEESESEESEEPDEIEQLLSTDPERLKEIARQAGSKALSRFAKLTAEKKALEQQLATRQAEAKPLPEAIPDNPFRGLDAKQVGEKRKELERVVETVESLLDKYEDYGPNDVIEYEGQQFPKSNLKLALRNANKSLSKYIPDQLTEIQRIEERAEQTIQWKERLVNEVPALADDSSDLSQKHKALMEQSIIKEMIANTPNFAPLAEHFVGHALNSMLNLTKKSKTPAPGQKPQPKVAGSPVGAAATASRPQAGVKVKEKEDKFMQTGRASDLVAFFAAQKS